MTSIADWDLATFSAAVLQHLGAEEFTATTGTNDLTCHPFTSRTPPAYEVRVIDVRLNLEQMFADVPQLLLDARTYS
jgi:hypothetical protein